MNMWYGYLAAMPCAKEKEHGNVCHEHRRHYAVGSGARVSAERLVFDLLDRPIEATAAAQHSA
ncbi:MAG: hypothetical protein WA021_05785, partial [Minisyncoccia bacterium]